MKRRTKWQILKIGSILGAALCVASFLTQFVVNEPARTYAIHAAYASLFGTIAFCFFFARWMVKGEYIDPVEREAEIRQLREQMTRQDAELPRKMLMVVLAALAAGASVALARWMGL